MKCTSNNWFNGLRVPNCFINRLIAKQHRYLKSIDELCENEKCFIETDNRYQYRQN